MHVQKPTLVVLAAGMGSRYGGLKQMDAFGPNGETIIDYSIYDAIRAGFGKVVFIIREHFRTDFEAFFRGKFDDRVKVVFVTQELHKIPSGFTPNPEREKPWGTAHAVLVARDVVNEPFAVINADDYYGTDAYSTLADFFNAAQQQPGVEDYAVVAYHLGNTLSDHGTVNRGVCESSENGYLKEVVERIRIGRDQSGRIAYPGADGEMAYLKEDTLVSMNLWAFFPSYFELCTSYFSDFLSEQGHALKSEFFIPLLIDKLIRNDQKRVRVLQSDAEWFGVTYQEDRPIVIDKLQRLIRDGVYPEKLWS